MSYDPEKCIYVKLPPGEFGRHAYEVRYPSGVLGTPDTVLGEVERHTRSTDSRIAGTRLHREGKGAPCWRALVPRSQQRPALGAARAPGRELQSTYHPRGGNAYRLEWRGQEWDRRADATEALCAWANGDRLATA